MTSLQYQCSQCRTILDDSKIESHISAQHLDYFPLECAWCKETNHSHFSTTKEDMKDHCSKNHTGNNSRYSAVENEGKEVELKKLAKECRDLRQIPSNHLECALPRVDGSSPTSNGNGADQDEADIIALRDNNETAAIPNDSLGYNLSEKPKEEIRPTAIAETGQVVDPIINPANDTPIDANEDQRKKRSH
ncbi:hypothetical protein Ddc_19210 [Ditylenchus destructor]|nr:hypothetical protein Ddc_19210 [Ditylenchus destructor]